MRVFPVLMGCWGVVVLSGCDCMDQYERSPRQWKLLTEERELAHRALPKLTEDGKLPAPVVANTDGAGGGSPVDEKFQTLCASCHGKGGDANTPMAQALKPPPRNFTDGAWQAKVDDAHIAKVIKDGGASVGLSPTMAPWGAMFKDDELQAMVKKIRSFKK